MNKYTFDRKEHIHTLNGSPLTGTSTVMSVIAKPLTYWAAGLAVAELGWTNPKFTEEAKRIETAKMKKIEIGNMDVASYLGLLDKAYRAHATSLNDSAQKGTDRHALIENYIKDCLKLNNGMPTNAGSDEVRPFIEWSKENVRRFLFSEMHTYSEKLWVGGIVDAGAELKNGEVAIIDIKSSKDAYATQFWQIAGYALQLEESGGFTSTGTPMMNPLKAQCYIVFPFGAPKPTGKARYDTDNNKKAFEACLTIYRQYQQLQNQ